MQFGILRFLAVALLNNGLFLILAAMVVWAIWRAGQPRRIFVVKVRAGEPQVIAGTVTPAFLQQLREIAGVHGVKKATVRGVARGRRIALQFSQQFPGSACQQLRNWWAISGWGL